MKKVLVTGSNGLLGQKLTDLYTSSQRERVQLIATGKGGDRYPFPGSYLFESLDITDENQVRDVFARHQPHCVIHTAAMTNVDQCETDHEGCDRLNIDALSFLLREAARYKTHFVHLSTDFIFDGEKGPYDEDAVPNPLSYYGYSKLKGEKLVMDYPYRWSILRTILVYGIVSDMSRSNIVLWAKSALEKGQKVNVVNDQYRTPTLAEDLAMGCMLAEIREANGIYNISGRDFMSITELVAKVADYWKLDKSLINPISSSTLSQAAKRPPRTGFLLAKAMRDLEYRPHSFEEGLEVMERQMNMGDGR